MERKEAVECLTEIITRSGWVPDAFSIVPCNGRDDSSGYKVTIASIDAELKGIINLIAQKRNLQVWEEKNTVTISESAQKLAKPC